jgi:hypothetical protein
MPMQHHRTRNKVERVGAIGSRYAVASAASF